MERSGDGIAGTGRTRRRRSGGLLLALVVLAPMGLLMLPTTLLLLPGLVPTMVAFVVDRDLNKSATISVGAMNICGIMPFLIQLWKQGHSSDMSFTLLSQPGTWLVMYGAAAIGWAIYFMVPPMVAGFGASRDRARIRELAATRAMLVDDWGPEVAGLRKAKEEPAATEMPEEEAAGEDRP